jgi:hypothetical protein
LKNIFGKSNKVVDALSGKSILLLTMFVEAMEPKNMKNLYATNEYVAQHRKCANSLKGYTSTHFNHFIEQCYLFRKKEDFSCIEVK